MAGVSVRRRRALLSVTDKSGLLEFARGLQRHGFELVASGGTATALREGGLPVIDVDAITGYPEIFGGRVKTLHPAVHGGILGPDEAAFAEVVSLGIAPIDLVVVNLYRFGAARAHGGTEADLVAKIDVGGPTMLRAAAKNFARVTVVPDPAHYTEVLAELDAHDGTTTPELRRRLAAAVFRLTERYDDGIADWLEGVTGRVDCGVHLRYGENPHQGARMFLPGGGTLADVGLTLHGGKELSYNNLVDLVAGLKLAADFDEPCCAILKHTNPCGFAVGEPARALASALRCDPVSAFGGVFAFNAEIDEAAAAVLAERFLEIIAAPAYTAGALERLTKKKNVRVLTADLPLFLAATRGRSRAWGGLMLRQDEDEGFPELADWRLAAGPEPDAATRAGLALGWKVAKHGKSNAIVLVDGTATLGCGFGQMSRVDSVELSIAKARAQGLQLVGALAASDGFFPFPDGIEKLAAAGIRAVVAPAGSIRDDDVAARAGELGVTLLLASRRHFNH
ncbi:MAG: bifunctional phosphoribosylaminoimidazolecarboxamide formyltransferase/IMP cyclohydrolase [bacterium]|nr:bifunctional phosphoribosylaminoimidazolecarboxamide formyltransferase/IMP cyclohydrolase [bacterium]